MSTLARIRTKIRRLTGSSSSLQLPDATIDEYINDFYAFDFPSHVKLFDLHQNYEFFTEPNEDRYVLPVNTYQGVSNPIYIAGYESKYTQSETEFFRLYPKNTYDENVATGDGSAGPYTFTLTATQILKRSFYCSAIDTNGDTLVVQDSDDGNGNLNPSNNSLLDVGDINYVTGAVTVTFSNAIPATSSINAQYVPLTPSRPTYCLFFERYFYLRPVPDKAYKFVCEIYRTPVQALSAADDSPDIQQWWQYIAFGAALKILEDRNDMDTLNQLLPRWEEQQALVLNRTALQQMNQSVATIYDESSLYPLNNFYSGGPF